MRYIHSVNLSAIDLNLLVAFDALFAEANVTRAARRVGLSQPAMSNALARLRDTLGDPLFVRTPRGMLATPRARELAAPVRAALATLETSLTGARFDPATASRTFTIAASDSIEILMGAPLVARLATAAPGVRVVIVPPARATDPTELLESERADVAIMNTWAIAPPLRTSLLFSQRLVVIARRGHPRIRRRLTMAQFTAVPHVLVAPYGTPGSIIDDALAKHRRTRTVAIRVSSFSSAPALVAETDCIAVIAERLARRVATWLPLQILELPLELRPVTIGQVWHPRVDADEAHRWFRGVLTEVAAG